MAEVLGRRAFLTNRNLFLELLGNHENGLTALLGFLVDKRWLGLISRSQSAHKPDWTAEKCIAQFDEPIWEEPLDRMADAQR